MVEAWLVNEPAQSQGWRVLPELPAAIYPGGRSGLVVQHVAGIDPRGRRHALVSFVNQRDRIALWLAKAAPCNYRVRWRNGRYFHSVWPEACVGESPLAAITLIFSRVTHFIS